MGLGPCCSGYRSSREGGQRAFPRGDIVNETDIRQATVRLAQHVAGQASAGGSSARHPNSSRRSSWNSDSSRTIRRNDREQTTLEVVGKAGADDRT
jgi:hypothetical protein